MSIEEHETRGMNALRTAEKYEANMGRRTPMDLETDTALMTAYSSLALAEFAAADIERRKEADQYQGGTVGARTLPAHWNTSTTEETDRG